VLQVLDKGNKEMDHLTKELMDAKLGSNSGGTSFKLAPCHLVNLSFCRLPFCQMIICFINLLIDVTFHPPTPNNPGTVRMISFEV
jgi:hypothetical protein